ncbi:hypothetical protein [Grimontia sp. SpTr1]|uniref:hypothetical protein n=1 Tax=Grimontia sp. SpTr1 TaxID=2995319 RepID=UPI00248B1558|nr:hypothetical protein [Grimontia sp. SpTr1]
MLRFQFYKSQDVVTHVKLDTPTTEDEIRQLTEQGFTESGDVISAPTILKAMEQHQNRHEDTIKEYATIGVILGLFSGYP